MAASASRSTAGTSCLASVVLLVMAGRATGAAEKETHLRVYWHDVWSGGAATVVQVAAQAANASATSFGSVFVIDDPLTEGPNLTSRLLGRAQGMYIAAGKDSLSLLMVMNFVFLDGGAYSGSSVAIVGPNPAARVGKEMPVVGGSGVFRFARGYCQARTYWFDAKTGDATVEYNIHLRHD